jgi:outer membrane protein TolC
MTKRIALLFLIAGWAASARAGDALPALTWNDVARLAAEKNPALAASRRAEEAARARYRGSYNGLLPRVSLSQKLADRDGGAGNGRWQASADASIDLLNVGNAYDVRAAADALTQTSAQRALTSSQTRFDAFSAYADLLFAQRSVAVSTRIADMRRRNAQMVKLKYESGRESKGNSMRAEAELVQAEADLSQANRELRTAQAELNRQLGREDFAALVATGTLTAPSLPAFPDAAAITAAHPQVRVAEAGLSRAKASLGRARSDFIPTLSASYSRNRNGRDYFPDEAHWSAAGIFTWPIFGRGVTASYFDAAAARRDFEQRQEDLRAARYQVRSAVESAWADLAGKIDQVRVQDGFLSAARQRNDESAIRYTSGLMTFENWELVVGDVVNFERGALRAERDAAVADAAWQKALGTPLEER